uniref:Putative plant transposon protein domain-containing protein n=1 Tax=Solanum tuberosum TaxID=4113 RepID=M1DPM1_SOLTU
MVFVLDEGRSSDLHPALAGSHIPLWRDPSSQCGGIWAAVVYWATTEGISSTDWSPDAKRWLHLVRRRIRPSSNRIDVTFPRALVVACTIQGIELNMGEQIISEWKMFYRGNNKAFLLPGLITALCKWKGVPLMDADEVLPMDPPPPPHPLLVRAGSISRRRRRRTGRARSSQAAGWSDEEGGDVCIIKTQLLMQVSTIVQ